jgi:lysyl-tRNA synthetase class 2
MSIPFIEENDQTRARSEHLAELRRLVGNVYPNKFERSRVTGDEDTITALVEKFKTYEPQVEEPGARPAPEVLERANEELKNVSVRISGRIATPPRVMGKAAFVHLSDGVSRLQIYVRKADVKGIHNDDNAPVEEGWELFNLLDHGDFVGVAGYLFVTKTGELSVHVTELQFLAKAMLPMPDKMHGIADPEIRQRQRYADLIAGSLKVEKDEESKDEAGGAASRELSSREVFERRSRIIREMRRFLDDHGYIEVETPMLSPKATGAVARPFVTHHNALDIDLYARIAPELYLKRLVVGGFERVYELNRNFRNEGIDRTHNPEFTMLEFYCAYMDVNGMMDFCEEMIRESVIKATGGTIIRFGNIEIDFGPKFKRATMKDAIVELLHFLFDETFDFSQLDDLSSLRQIHAFLLLRDLGRMEAGVVAGFAPTEALFLQIQSQQQEYDRTSKDENWRKAFLFNTTFPSETEANENGIKLSSLEFLIRNLIKGETEESQKGYLVEKIFAYSESKITQPTFITNFPKVISPLSKASPMNPAIAERFELFIAGMECANGFSELNDPQEQYDRFLDQAQQRERGDDEAMVLDEDYIRSLSYGMPPAAGIGIGIDRLVMLLTGKRSIRDVILFPHMRPERKAEEAGAEKEE